VDDPVAHADSCGSATPAAAAGVAGRVDAAFAPDGALSCAIPGFSVRPQQLEMAHAVAEALEDRAVLVAEAGTGTGKTFAYLVPSLLSGGKVIVSTGTKTLQDQLFQRDLPMVREALGVPVSIALLKGRANYICHYHLERARRDGRFESRADVDHLERIARHARTSLTGDRGGLPDVPEDASIWPQVTSTRENCLGQECPNHQECFVLKARREALEADVVVVNHHLFFADVMLRDEGAGELLPKCNAVILDEAHQLPATASVFFGRNVSTGQLVELARDVRGEVAAGARDFPELAEAARATDKAARDLRLVFVNDGGRLSFEEAMRRNGLVPAARLLLETLERMAGLLETQAERSEGLKRCWERALEQQALLQGWLDQDDPEMVRWVEVFGASVQLQSTPLSVGPMFRRQVEEGARAWVLTSATLSVRGDFTHFLAQLGIDDARSRCWDSPFDYGRQAMLYAPTGMPDPNTAQFTAAVVERAMPLIEASGGRAFCLFTSLRAMREARELIQRGLAQRGLDLPVLVQGEGARTDLLERFRRLGNAILVGSQSFWEGVDVRGPTLSLVVIDRLPFTPPDDPVLQARIERIRTGGGNPFMDYQLPQAVITLKQGAGRLIRDEQDTGVLVICDPRLVDKPYGRRIWQSLPAMRRSRVEAEAVAFLAGEADLSAATSATPAATAPATPER
jgi:ATP-dependent DNA helicase DinG